MTIRLGNTTLCAGSTRNATGSPVGPDNVAVSERPGAVLREYVGADRVNGEHVGCDHGTFAFQVTRIYASVDAATAYATAGHRSEAKAGALVVANEAGTESTVYANAVLVAKDITQRGVAVAVKYTIEG